MEIRETAGGIVVGPDNKIVVVSQNGDSWSLPKGGVDDGETPLQTAEREIREESGINDLELVCELGTYKRPRIGKDGHGDVPNQMKVITFFLFKTKQAELQPEDPLNPEAIWLSLGEAANRLTHAKDKEFLESKIPIIEQELSKL
jgi:ADP-ribose pyrophosphatase YjhB (NUDIX family)